MRVLDSAQLFAGLSLLNEVRTNSHGEGLQRRRGHDINYVPVYAWKGMRTKSECRHPGDGPSSHIASKL